MPHSRPLAFKVTERGCFEVTSHVTDDRGRTRVMIGHTTVFAHRHVWEECFGPIPRGLCVCHTCDNPGCVNSEHLFLGTIADNCHDRDAKGRSAIPPHSKKLPPEVIEHIRKRYRSGDRMKNSARAIARELGVCHKTILNALNGTPVHKTTRLDNREWYAR